MRRAKLGVLAVLGGAALAFNAAESEALQSAAIFLAFGSKPLMNKAGEEDLFLTPKAVLERFHEISGMKAQTAFARTLARDAAEQTRQDGDQTDRLRKIAKRLEKAEMRVVAERLPIDDGALVFEAIDELMQELFEDDLSAIDLNLAVLPHYVLSDRDKRAGETFRNLDEKLRRVANEFVWKLQLQERDGADLAGETWSIFLHKLTSEDPELKTYLGGPGKLEAYLYWILRSVVFSHQRLVKDHLDSLKKKGMIDVMFPAKVPDAERTILERERRAILKTSVPELTDLQRRVLELELWGELPDGKEIETTREILEQEGFTATKGSVKGMRDKARTALRRVIFEMFPALTARHVIGWTVTFGLSALAASTAAEAAVLIPFFLPKFPRRLSPAIAAFKKAA
jgi:hypothetical protein